ncbi:Predicted O-methyltransferase YrrM [Bryocella elongata]|uniref:Predicted O-methyltransferase YrrM n=1 Tax=Bryocella elongata TaxID=863522 RepID=A0A1H6BPP9_9BACT|nr:O-methyltransferase [Bryocella elongata]SEG62654.1 Predicted O-methyltransferase YrrM [Bryocella elongata]
MAELPREWVAVDDYVSEVLLGTDAVLEQTLATNGDAGLPSIDVSPAQGRFLELLALSMGAKRILELGTLGGYSTICLARALPKGKGKVISLEFSERHAEIARGNIARAGFADVVEVRVGPALESMRALLAEKPEPFDLVFLDADKDNNPHYLAMAMEMVRVGSVILIDNVVREGELANAASDDVRVQGQRQAIELMGKHPRLRGTVLQTVGDKGYDGFAMGVVVG